MIFLISSSELENTLIEHNNFIHYIVVIDGNGVDREDIDGR